MEFFSEGQILHFFAQYAYQPGLVYTAVITLMFMSSFGLPAPEEITLLAIGLVSYMGSRPDLYPPPSPGAPVVNAYTASIVCLVAVILSDLVVFMLGRHFGGRLLQTKWLRSYQERLEQVVEWTKKYGQWAAGIFRFTPGLRFPGHFSCGMMGLSPAKFLLVDGTAALISVPTQVMLISFFGEAIFDNIRQFKLVLFFVIGFLIVYLLSRRWLIRRRAEGEQNMT